MPSNEALSILAGKPGIEQRDEIYLEEGGDLNRDSLASRVSLSVSRYLIQDERLKRFVQLKLHVKIIIAQLGKATFWEEANFSCSHRVYVEVCHHSKTSTSIRRKSITTSSFGQMRAAISGRI